MMRYLFVFMLVTGIAVVSACKAKQESGTVVPKDQAKAGRVGKMEGDSLKQWYGREIISETTARLSRRLQANDTIAIRIKSSLMEAFTAAGGNLHTTYPDAEAKAFSKKLVRNASPGFKDLLDARQKQVLEKLVAE